MLEVGMKLEVEKIVTENDTAAKAASGSVEVLATPIMIAWMEEASLHLAQKGLEEGLTTVGTEVNIKHLKGTLVGKTVKIVSVLKVMPLLTQSNLRIPYSVGVSGISIPLL